jgi:hypothetical protein
VYFHVQVAHVTCCMVVMFIRAPRCALSSLGQVLEKVDTISANHCCHIAEEFM